MTATNENMVVRMVPTVSGTHVRHEVDMVTGEVSRYMLTYRVALKTEAARRLFLDGVGFRYAEEVKGFIVECNKEATRKPARSARPHGKSCDCPPCLREHIRAGCRKVGCRVCFA